MSHRVRPTSFTNLLRHALAGTIVFGAACSDVAVSGGPTDIAQDTGGNDGAAVDVGDSSAVDPVAGSDVTDVAADVAADVDDGGTEIADVLADSDDTSADVDEDAAADAADDAIATTDADAGGADADTDDTNAGPGCVDQCGSFVEGHLRPEDARLQPRQGQGRCALQRLRPLHRSGRLQRVQRRLGLRRGRHRLHRRHAQAAGRQTRAAALRQLPRDREQQSIRSSLGRGLL
jgi:hypothetical protein